ncbi:MAG: hypothetical protein ABUL73_00195 [Alphaproteobacteria bacterium]
MAPPHGQVIATNVEGEGHAGLFSEVSLYAETPIHRSTNFSVVAAPWTGQDPTSSQREWRGEATLSIKAAVLRTRMSAVSVQAGLAWRSDPKAGCGETGAEVRFLGGSSFGRHGRSFFNVEAAALSSGAHCSVGRFDLTAGYHASERWMGMAQVFTEGRRGSDKVLLGQVSLVRMQSESRGIQFGVRARLDDGEREPALVIAFWRR